MNEDLIEEMEKNLKEIESTLEDLQKDLEEIMRRRERSSRIASFFLWLAISLFLVGLLIRVLS